MIINDVEFNNFQERILNAMKEDNRPLFLDEIVAKTRINKNVAHFEIQKMVAKGVIKMLRNVRYVIDRNFQPYLDM